MLATFISMPAFPAWQVSSMKPTVRQADHRLARRKWRTTKPSEVARRALRREGSTGKPEPRGCRSTVCGARKTLGTKLDLSRFLPARCGGLPQEPLGFSPREFQNARMYDQH